MQPALEEIRQLQELARFYEWKTVESLDLKWDEAHMEFGRKYHETCDRLNSISPNLDPRPAE